MLRGLFSVGRANRLKVKFGPEFHEFTLPTVISSRAGGNFPSNADNSLATQMQKNYFQFLRNLISVVLF